MARKLIVEIIGDARSLEKSYRTAEQQTKSFGKKSQSLGRTLVKTGAFAGAAAGIGALTAAFKVGIGEFNEAQKVSAQTAAVLKSTGGAANVSAKHIDELASSILSYSGIDDEAVKSGENLLLTFTNIRNQVGKNNDIFDQATKVMADMSTALGQDTTSSAIQLGKALNDPVRGVTALRRVGVSFTKEQQKQIKTLVESGKTMDAQKLILKELNKEFGGSAAAAGKTFGGQLNILKESLANVSGEIVAVFMPTLQRLLERANKWISNAKNQKRVVDDVKAAFSAVSAVIKTLITAFQTLSKIVGGNRNAIILLVAAYATFKVASIASSVAGLAQNFGLLTTKTRGATAATRGLSASFLGKAGLAAGVVLAGYELSNFIRKIPGWDNAMKGFGSTLYDVGAGLGLVNGTGSVVGEGQGRRSQATSAFLIARARRLQLGGMSAAESAVRLRQTHPALTAGEAGVYATAAAGQVQHIHVNVDGREVARVVNTHNARTGHRTATQTSGLNG